MITYQSEGVELPELDYAKVSRWLTGVAAGYGRRIGEMVYLFCNDDKILSTNREFLDHDYYTDIITFDYSLGPKIGGDILISLDTVRSNAEERGIDYPEELLRVIVHGVLHLCGLKDKQPEDRDKMEAAENAALRDFATA